MKIKILLTVALVAIVSLSCSEKTELGNTDLLTIDFEPTISPQSKSGYLDANGGFSVGDVIGVFGYQTQSSVWSNNELPELMHNVTLTKQSFDAGAGSVVNYVYNPQKLWPTTGKSRFFAYFPHSSSVQSGVMIPSSRTYTGYPFVEVVLGLSKTPIDFVTAQTGLMSKPADVSNDGVELKFYHRLSKLYFKVKASGLNQGLSPDETRKMYINRLKIKNVFNKAKYTFDDNAVAQSSGTWSEYALQGIDATSGATIAANHSMVEIGDTYQDLIDPRGAGSYLLMIPQTYDNVEFEVIYTIERLNVNGGCEDRTVIIKKFPASVNWKSGQVYTYSLEFGFVEVDEGAISLSLSVKPWVSDGYGIEMGS